MPPRRRREHKGQVSEFTKVISERRLALGKTQAEIARDIGVSSPEFIGMVEAGLRRIDLNRVPMLARALNYDPAELCKLALQEQAPELFRTLFGGAYSFTPKELSPQEVNTVHVSRDTRELLERLHALPAELTRLIEGLVRYLYSAHLAGSRLPRSLRLKPYEL
ncbi:MAG: hypothetical protein DMG25_14480 [Acidobacteria bacterium]|nr:MAG: hypothetical protein DMG25_14480 [Acidobacteriota bacterium]